MNLVLLVIFTFLINTRVHALYKVVSSFLDSIRSRHNGLMKQDGTNIYEKFFDGGDDARAFCTRFKNDFIATQCSATWWSSDYTEESNLTKVTENRRIAAAVGAMINKARSLSGGSAEHIDKDVYFYTEMAINNFLYNYNGNASFNDVAGYIRNWSNISSRATYKAIYSAGTAAYDDFGVTTAKFSNVNIEYDNNGNVTATADFTCYDSKNNKITCAARCKKTAKIKVTYSGGTEETISDIDSTCPRITNDPVYRYTANHTFTIPENNTISNVNVTFETDNYTSYPVAQEYFCNSNTKQNLTPNLLKTFNYKYNVKKL